MIRPLKRICSVMDCKSPPALPFTLTVTENGGEHAVSFDVCNAHQEWTLEQIVAALKTDSHTAKTTRYECSACKTEVSIIKQFFVGAVGHEICLPCFSGQPLAKLLSQLPTS